MKILLTGAFGTIGRSTLDELLRQGHQVRCLIMHRSTHERIARRYANSVELFRGDLRHPAELLKAVQGQDCVIHLAYIIPPRSEEQSEFAHAVNVDGTRHLLAAASSQAQPPMFLFASSLDVFGHTQDQTPPRKATDPVQATDHYTAHKIMCEEMVRNSGLQWSIYRFADVPPLGLRTPHPIMYSIPLATRFEVVHTYDAGLAIANGIRSTSVWKKIMLIGGGSSCQIFYQDLLQRMLDMMGIGMLPESAFGTDPYCTDWLDTEESQRLLNYQRYSFDDIMADVKRAVGYRRVFTAMVRPLARWWILRMSPYYQASARKHASAPRMHHT